MLPLTKLTSQDSHSDSALVLTKACTASESTGRPRRENRGLKSNKELNLQAVGFRTYESSLFQELPESGHGQFMALIGLTEFMKLSWTKVHRELAIEFLKNYRKKKSSRMSLSSSVRSKRIILTKKLIASTFHLSPSGYKHKNRPIEKKAVSSLFDPVAARRSGYYIRDCKDPAYFERLEVLNRLIGLKPPGHLISAVLVDMVIHAAIEPVDWAGVLLFSLMKELDRVTSSLRQSPCTIVGVHIFLILSYLKIATTEDTLSAESHPFILLDGYSTATSAASDSCPSSAKSSLQGSPRSLNSGPRFVEIVGSNRESPKPSNVSSPDSSSSAHSSLPRSLRSLTPGSRIAEILGSHKEVQEPPGKSSPDSCQLALLADAIDTSKPGQRSTTVPSGSIRIARRDIPSMSTNMGGQKPSRGPSGNSGRDLGTTDIGGRKSTTISFGSFQRAAKRHFSLRAIIRHLKTALQCFQPEC